MKTRKRPVRTDAELSDAVLANAILAILSDKPASVSQLCHRLHENIDRVWDMVLNLERRGKLTRLADHTPWTVSDGGLK